MVQSVTDDFEIVWKDPADAAITWKRDPMHFPRPAPPLTLAALARLTEDVFGSKCVGVNGFLYDINAAPPPPTPDIIERGVFTVWEEDYVPRIKEACRRIRGTNYEAMSAVELADSLDSLIQDTVDTFRYTMTPVFAFMGPTFALVDFAERELGADGSQLLATLLQGAENSTAAAGEGLDELAQTAASLPEVAKALRDGRRDNLEPVSGGKDFLAQLQRYLDEYGWRAESWGLPHIPTWAEDHSVPLMLISRYLADENLSQAAAIQRSRDQRDEAMREVESRLSGDKLAEFRDRLAACAGHVSISEGRARWQLTIIGSFRVPALALGRKLVEAGVVGEPNDAFFLSVEELKEAARNPSRSEKSLIAGRKADLARWERQPAPIFLGPPPAEPPAEMHAILTKFFGVGVTPSTDEKVINGNAASRGVARGRARIIHEISEGDKLQKGEILVCTTTAPPWTPLFAIAAGVVTDTGGILCHSAICAREYGIPCVVGTQVGTSQIPDGATITVDGEKGTVRIESD